MIQWILKNIICHEFETRVGKGHRMKDGHDYKKDPVPAMHLVWEISPYCEEEQDAEGEQQYQYKRVHMLICGPNNYVYVTTQVETIDMDGEQSFEPMEIIGYHDSCWRDSVDRFIRDNRHKLMQLRCSGSLFGWHDVYDLTPEEVEYLGKVEQWRRNKWGKDEVLPPELVSSNPIQKRWVR